MEANYTFLLIEDNVIEQLITSKLLKKSLEVHEINIANNGREGLSWLMNHQAKPDEKLIILLDIKMPEMDGFGFLSEYEKLTKDLKKQTQIFILSSTLNPDEINRAKNDHNVKDIISKPFPFKEFGAMIQSGA